MQINIQKCDLRRGGMSSEFDKIVAIEAFKELHTEVGTMRPREKDVIDKT